MIPVNDKTSYGQSLTHMIKGNLGTGILAMPASFAHAGLVYSVIGLPLLCWLATYCVHLLVDSSRNLQGKSKHLADLDYGDLAKHSFHNGPSWMRRSAKLMSRFVDLTLLVSQTGVCCVYIVFIVENVKTILASHGIHANQNLLFLAVFPPILLLSCVRTLKRLSIASACANVLQVSGICIVLEYLLRDLNNLNLAERDMTRSFGDVALGFGSAMFAFEGISVILPIFARMKNPERMSGLVGVVNVSYIILLMLYFVVGLFGFLKFGRDAKGSVTLNLPPEPIYDVVRAMFTLAVMLSYPLQFYVPNEILWNWARQHLLLGELPSELVAVGGQSSQVTNGASSSVNTKPLELINQSKATKMSNNETSNKSALTAASSTGKTPIDLTSNLSNRPLGIQQMSASDGKQLIRYEYLNRCMLVVFTFVLAYTIPKLNLLMDLIGSFSGAILSVVLPAVIHLAAFWDDLDGPQRAWTILIDFSIIVVGMVAVAIGSWFSIESILNSFSH